MAVVFIVSLAVASNSSGDKPVPDILKIVECQWVPTGGSHSSNLGGGGGSLFVTQVMEIDAPINANFNWQIQTDKDHVLVFTVVGKGGNFEQVQEFLSVRLFIFSLLIRIWVHNSYNKLKFVCPLFSYLHRSMTASRLIRPSSYLRIQRLTRYRTRHYPKPSTPQVQPPKFVLRRHQFQR